MTYEDTRAALRAAMPAGDRRSVVAGHPAVRLYAVPPACGGLCRCEHRRSLTVARSTMIGRTRSSLGCAQRCRPEVGVPSRPRGSFRLAVLRLGGLRVYVDFDAVRVFAREQAESAGFAGCPGPGQAFQ